LGKFRFFLELDVIYNALSNGEDQPNQWLDIIIRQTMEWHLPNDASLDLDNWATPLCLGHDKLAVSWINYGETACMGNNTDNENILDSGKILIDRTQLA